MGSGMKLKLFYASTVLLALSLSGCNTDTVTSDEQTDPVLVEFPVVYIERSAITNHVNLDSSDEETPEPAQFFSRNPVHFNPGASLLMKKNAFAESIAVNLTQSLFFTEDAEPSQSGNIDIRDLRVASDGQSFLVSIRAPEITDADENEQPRWNIWYYQQSTNLLAPLITNAQLAEQGDDLMANYLPDGRIIFASNRQKNARAILLDEGKPQYTAMTERSGDSAFNIHIINADGSNIKQLTFNLSHDFYPLILQSGHVLYSRWDSMGGNDKINLYRMNPDGTDNQLIYGWHSQQVNLSGELVNLDYINVQQLPNGELFIAFTANEASRYQKLPMTLNIDDFSDFQQPLSTSNVVDASMKTLFSNGVFNFSATEDISNSGKVNFIYPLPDNSERYLLSWDLCKVIFNDELKACGQLTTEQLAQEGLAAAPESYELWLYNAKDNTQRMVAQPSPDSIITEAMVMQPSEVPPIFIADKGFSTGLDVGLANEQAGAIHIRSVYDFDGVDVSAGIDNLKDPTVTAAANLPARFLRIIRGVPMPPPEVRQLNGTDFGASTNQLMREIIGYTPIQPDGSVKVKVPANVPLALSVLDAQGQRIGGRHRQWITVTAGETLECHGCHSGNSQIAHGRFDAQLPSINSGAASTGISFPHTNSDIVPIAGQTMAEADEHTNELATVTADIVYRDIWTDENLSAKNEAFTWSYQQLTTELPNGVSCFEQWTAYCRIQINYQAHIQPLWQLSRPVIDENTQALLGDNQCTGCHSVTDEDNLAQVPAAQLDLSENASSDQPAHVTSYRELFFNDVEQEVVEGILIDKRVPALDGEGNIIYQRDADGELILDEDDNPIEVLTTIAVSPMLNVNSARNNSDFFQLFNEATHNNMLSEHELKLLSEWLDIGGQYYNTPFYPQE